MVSVRRERGPGSFTVPLIPNRSLLSNGSYCSHSKPSFPRPVSPLTLLVDLAPHADETLIIDVILANQTSNYQWIAETLPGTAHFAVCYESGPGQDLASGGLHIVSGTSMLSYSRHISPNRPQNGKWALEHGPGTIGQQNISFEMEEKA